MPFLIGVVVISVFLLGIQLNIGNWQNVMCRTVNNYVGENFWQTYRKVVGNFWNLSIEDILSTGCN
jgi:hypothetical protein